MSNIRFTENINEVNVKQHINTPLEFSQHIPSTCTDLFAGHYLSLEKFNLLANPSCPDIEGKWRTIWREFSSFGIVKLSMSLNPNNELEIRRVVPNVPHNSIEPDIVFPTEGLTWKEKIVGTETHCLLSIESTEMIVSLCDLTQTAINPYSAWFFQPTLVIQILIGPSTLTNGHISNLTIKPIDRFYDEIEYLRMFTINVKLLRTSVV